MQFTELEECRAFELLKSSYDRANYLLTKQAKIIAMTCTHAALKVMWRGMKFWGINKQTGLPVELFIKM